MRIVHMVGREEKNKKVTKKDDNKKSEDEGIIL